MSKKIKLKKDKTRKVKTWGQLLHHFKDKRDEKAKEFFAALMTAALSSEETDCCLAKYITWTQNCTWCSENLPSILLKYKLPNAIFECYGKSIFQGYTHTMLEDGTMIIPGERLKSKFMNADTKRYTAKIKAILSRKSSFNV